MRIDRAGIIGNSEIDRNLWLLFLMSSRLAFPIVFGSFVLTALVGVAAVLLLRACALPLPFLNTYLSACAAPSEIATAQALDASMGQGLDLQRRIFELERELAARQCVKAPPDPTAPMTDEAWNAQDLEMLYGCWALDTTYRTRDVDTGEIRSYAQWQMCFDAHGNGTQTMQSNDGVTCEGTVRAEFSGGSLQFIEPGNLACGDTGYIHKRQITCTQDGAGAICETLQPETGGKATVGFDRAAPPQ
ncbi:hypothetical protein [Ascidiaceihabitans sp.]|uniref:hypothetical protein n=1 Tax=Ascidiaceihabitans sp. TaxID=1872644 RepID=UPI003297908A